MEQQAHLISQNQDQTYTCQQCLWSWKHPPSSPCPGVPHYMYGQWPEHLYTATQLRRLHLKPAQEPDGCYFIVKAPHRRYLYDINKAMPRRVPTPAQHQAIEKMRAGLVKKYTCQQCGYYDESHGRGRRKYGRVQNGYCSQCWREIRHRSRQADVTAWAQRYMQHPSGWIVLDTETTGLSEHDEVIEIAIVTATGTVLFSSFIQTQNPGRPDLATHIHGITHEMLADAPTFPAIWPLLKAILRRYRCILVYNAAFDHHLLDVTAKRYGYRLPFAQWDCLMEQYAVYHGAWHSYFQYTWQKFSVACVQLGVEDVGQYHWATANALNALHVLQALVARDQQSLSDLMPHQQIASICEDTFDHPF